jgi:hypothetical protein
MGGGGVRSEETGQLAGWTRGTKGDGRNERHRHGRRRREERQRDNQPDDERLGGVRRVAGVVSRHGRRLLDDEVRRDGSSTAMDGATAPRRRGTARRLLDGEGRRATAPRRRGTARDGSSTARDGASAAAMD